jgi:hypothetical protein
VSRPPTPSTHRDVDRMIELARGEEPGALPETDLRRLVRKSVVAAIERRSHTLQWRALVWACALSAVVLAALFSPLRQVVRERWLQPSGSAAERAGSTKSEESWLPLEVALPTGDRLAASPGAQFEIVQGARITRRIALREGTVVFSVEPLASGETFGVQTPHVYVEVRGTVFSVEVDGQRSRVRVHEGSVQVLGTVAPKTLRAGERYGTDGQPVPELGALPLAKRAAELSAERLRAKARAEDERAAPDASVGPGNEPPLHQSSRAVTSLTATVSTPLDLARALLHKGDAMGALMAAEAALPSATERGEWLLLQGDALRSLNQPRQAIASYLDAEASLDTGSASRAAFKAADLHLRVLGDPSAALAVLNRTRLDAPGSPLRERALSLRIEAAQRLGLPVRALAQRYLDAYPDSAAAERMRKLVQAQ